MRSSSSHRARTVLGVAALSVVTLTGCISTPSAKRVALDIVDTLDEPESVKQCMRDRIDEYSKDELQSIADGAADPTSDGYLSDLGEIGDLEADLTACRADAPSSN